MNIIEALRFVEFHVQYKNTITNDDDRQIFLYIFIHIKYDENLFHQSAPFQAQAFAKRMMQFVVYETTGNTWTYGIIVFGVIVLFTVASVGAVIFIQRSQ
ncbi:Hypothetical_protein [Hexamita inflata]|uniref:Hypothetical_protein n=1 Tax=Hexamita inflata TaxID=28002 RepID=A0ABP1J6R8_9EUKA